MEYNNYLSHHGILGMRWGRRKDKTGGGWKHNKKNKNHSDNDQKMVSNVKQPGNQKMVFNVKQPGNLFKKSFEQNRYVKRKIDISKLSTKELNELVERKRAENNWNRLEPNNLMQLEMAVRYVAAISNIAAGSYKTYSSLNSLHNAVNKSIAQTKKKK